MDKLERLHKSLRRAIRILLAINALFTVAFVVGLAAHAIATRNPGNALERDEDEAYQQEEQTQITSAEAASATTGKAAFRTYATRRAKVVDELSHFQLQGISMRDGNPSAYVRDTKLKKTLVKKVGDAIGPYEVLSITEEGVTVRRGSEEVILPKG